MNTIVKVSILSALFMAFSQAVFADGVVLYSNIPDPVLLAPNPFPAGFKYSAPYEAGAMGEFGGLIQFAGGSSEYSLTSATFVLNSGAVASDFTDYIDGTLAAPTGYAVTPSGFYVPMTLSFYNTGPATRRDRRSALSRSMRWSHGVPNQTLHVPLFTASMNGNLPAESATTAPFRS